MALKESCGKGRFSNFSIAKLLEKGEEEEEEREESEDEETRVGREEDWEEKTKEEEGGDHHIKQEKIELLGAAELSGLIKYHSCFMRSNTYDFLLQTWKFKNTFTEWQCYTF